MTQPVRLKQFAVVGNPVAHSRSPTIHTQFGAQVGVALDYRLIACPLDAFADVVRRFFTEGGDGLNITLPFKEEAWELAAAHLSPRARLAGAVNTLWMQNGLLHGCNTDGVGLLADIRRLRCDPRDKSILLVGAGGAAKGVVYPLLEAGCARLHIVNRSAQRALDLAQNLGELLPDMAARLSAGGLDDATGQWDLIINATSSSLTQDVPDLPGANYADHALAYDMVYAAEPTPFLQHAQTIGASQCADGLGMLVAQAAASFAIWNGIAPDIEPVMQSLRRQISTA